MKKLVIVLMLLLIGAVLSGVAFAEKEWVVTQCWQGTGMQTTQIFVIEPTADSWVLEWEATDEVFAGAGILQVFLYRPNGQDGELVDLPVNQLGIGEGRSWNHFRHGPFWLDINSANLKWEIRVVEYK